jgi:hypothetical protein
MGWEREGYAKNWSCQLDTLKMYIVDMIHEIKYGTQKYSQGRSNIQHMLQGIEGVYFRR